MVYLGQIDTLKIPPIPRSGSYGHRTHIRGSGDVRGNWVEAFRRFWVTHFNFMRRNDHFGWIDRVWILHLDHSCHQATCGWVMGTLSLKSIKWHGSDHEPRGGPLVGPGWPGRSPPEPSWQICDAPGRVRTLSHNPQEPHRTRRATNLTIYGQSTESPTT